MAPNDDERGGRCINCDEPFNAHTGGWCKNEEEAQHTLGRLAGLKEAADWLRRQASAEKEPKAKAAFVEAHNAILAIAEGRCRR
jgi:hypothetical protein